MPNARRSRAVLAATLLLMGCQAAPPSLRPIKALRPEIEKAAPRAGALRMMLRQQAVTPAMAARFGLLDVQQLDWDTVRVWLSNSRDGDSGRPGFFTRRLRGTAVVDNATNERTSSLIFDDLTPSDGYSLLVRLYRGGDQPKFDTYAGTEAVHDSPEMIASGTSTDFEIRSGGNTVNVALTLSTGGRFNVTIDEPATTANQTIAGQFDITTQSHYNYTLLANPTTGDIDGANANDTDGADYELSGLAREQDATGAIYFTSSGRHQIFMLDSGVVSLIAGTGTVTAGDYSDAGDYGDALNATLSDPRGIVRATTDDHIIFCDTNNGRIRILRPGNLDPENNEPLATNDAPTYRIETLIGGWTSGLTNEGDTATDALKIQLASPTAIIADEDGTLFFTDDDVANSQICVYRYDGTGTGGDITLIKEIPLATGAVHTNGEHYGALALDRLNNMLWVAFGGPYIKVLTDINAAGAATDGGTIDQDNTASWVASGERIKALAFDQTTARAYTGNQDRWGTLFFTTENSGSGDLVYRVPVASNGLMPSYRFPEPIAGGAASGLSAPRARSLSSLALGWGSLLVDLYQSDQASTDTRLLVGTDAGRIYQLDQVEGLVATTTLDDVANP
ncbi:MAG: hypothetical protein VKQ33_09555 [Candidatus Sericytochromatia bacterium]|nr:hypothetical protein [Candidatus Sericytochromatia bacterium]